MRTLRVCKNVGKKAEVESAEVEGGVRKRRSPKIPQKGHLGKKAEVEWTAVVGSIRVQ
jgi:hypothetical protein